MVQTVAENSVPVERARAVLAQSPIYVLRDLCVEQIGRRLFISGHVDTFYHKQLAQEVVRNVAGGLEVVNDANVSTP